MYSYTGAKALKREGAGGSRGSVSAEENLRHKFLKGFPAIRLMVALAHLLCV